MLHLICALKCEARPLIDYFHLHTALNTDAFPCYITRGKNISLTICKPGKQNAAAATEFTREYFNCRKSAAWLNIGIAGHRFHDIGRIFLANKIEDASNGKTWFPQIVFAAPCQSDALKTLDKPSTDYDNLMYDMEASGFYSVASRTGTSELIHVLKIISDNSENPAQKPDEKYFSGLVQQQLPVIDQVIESLSSLSFTMESIQEISPYFDICLRQWHFSQYEQHVLKRILERWHALIPGEDPILYSKYVRSGKELIKQLEQKLDETGINF